MARVRWYLGYKCRKNPQELVKQISQKVQEYNLSQYIPLLRLEKGVKSRSEFYFFIAIESSLLGQIPLEVTNSNLLKLPFFSNPAVKGGTGFTYEQIKQMVRAAHDIHDYTNPIPYQPLQEIVQENPFNLLTTSLINYSPINLDANYHCYQQLLYWLSAIGCGTWNSFQNACDALNLQEPKRILRRLRLLGHIETSLDGSRWSIAPTTLVKINSQSEYEEFILCGQRSINLLQTFEKYLKLEVLNQPRGDAPPCILLKVNDSDTLTNLLTQINREFIVINVGEVSKQLADILPDLNNWKQNLRSLQGIVPSLYEWEWFDGNDFVPCIPSESGMYRMYNQKMKNSPLYTIFYDKETDKWLQGDWYGLRFLALQHMGDKCIINYDLNTKRLAIPASQRLPEIYERALVLASGLLPTYVDSWFLYANVEPEVVQMLSAKLNLICNRVSTHA